MGEARRRKLAGTYPESGRIEQQAAEGIIMLTFNVEPIPQLHCVLPIRNAMKHIDATPLRNLPYPNLLKAMRGEFAKANQTQDYGDIQFASLVALCSVLQNPMFGAEARVLLGEVRRNRHNIGLLVVGQQDKLTFGVGTGIANVAMGMIGKPQKQDKFPTPEAQASETWRTHVDPEKITEFGIPQAHLVLFEPVDDPSGMGHSVSISIPETPQSEIRHALNVAIKAKARTIFTCDTAEQAAAMADYVTPLLPKHRRIANERAGADTTGP